MKKELEEAMVFFVGDRVSGYDDVEEKTIFGTVMGHRGEDVLVKWDCESYDSSSRGHLVPSELLKFVDKGESNN